MLLIEYPEGRHQLSIKCVRSTYLPMECNYLVDTIPKDIFLMDI